MSQSQAFQRRIEYSDILLRQLEETLSISIANAKGRVKLSRKPKAVADHFYCAFQYLDDSNYRRYAQPDTKSTEWTLTKALKKGAATASVWLGVRLRFDSEAESAYLTSASVMVLAHRESFFPLVRAEWDYRGVCHAQHAQPHWHVLTALQASTRASAAAVSVPPTEFSGASLEEGSTESEILHLAMSTDWAEAKGNKHICELPDAANLRNWLARTVEYSIEQVQYALSKTRTAADSSPKDFSPSPSQT
jgi:hypothetical protein